MNHQTVYLIGLLRYAGVNGLFWTAQAVCIARGEKCPTAPAQAPAGGRHRRTTGGAA